MINIDGLVSGIDTEKIISGLLDIQKQQLDQFQTRIDEVRTKQSAFQAVQAQLLSLRSAASSLSRTQNNPFDSRTISVSHPDSLVATVGSKAASGVYQIQIDALARAHQVASQGLADADSAITEGTIQLRIGNQAQTTITIDASNNTLSGLADAINFAQSGVSATIVHDGTTSGTPYRLLLTSTKTGESGAITLTNNLADSASGAVKPAFDFDNPVQAAANAQVRLGEGAGALTVHSETNRISNLISGVTLNLLQADANQTVTLSVAQDSEKAVTAVQDFVTAYNGVLDFLDELTKYDPGTDTAGLLIGDRSILTVRNELQLVQQSVIPGTSSQANRLSAIGISTNDKGRLAVNTSRLQDVVDGKVAGVTPADLRRLFALDGVSTSGNVEFLLGSSRTKDSTTPYQVQITQAAERASITAGGTLAASTVVDETNDTLTLNVDGAEISVTLSAGEYTAAELAAHLQSAINADPTLGGRSVTAGVAAGDLLALRSDSYGSSSQITIVSGSALGILGLSGGESDAGVDVAGHFIVNGEIETATGRGRILSGDKDNEHTADLQLRVTFAPSQISEALEAEVTVSRGVTSRLDVLIGKLVESDTGLLNTVNKGFNAQIDSIQSTIDRQQAAFDVQQESLIKQFTALESILGQLQNTSGLLGTQLASLNSLSANF